MRSYDPSQPLLYLHLPRCAGSSIVFLLARWFCEGYHKLNQDGTCDQGLPQIATRDGQGNWLPNVKCLHGHFDHGRGYGLPNYYPEVKQCATILRDPFDVAVSMYFFAKQKSTRGENGFRGTQVDMRQEFSSVVDFVRDYPFWFFDHLPVDIDLSNYREKFLERFVYIGVFEDLATSIQRMAKVLNKKPFGVPHLNVSLYDEPVPEALRWQFYKDYPLLKAIHDFAMEHYRKI